MVRRLLLISAAAAVLLLSACGQSSSKPDAPQSPAVAAGDGQVVVTWAQDASLQYWIFMAQADAISLNSYFNDPQARVLTPVYSPQIVAGLTNGLPYSFIVNATKNGGPAGPDSPSMRAVPQLAGQTWVNKTGSALATTTNFEGIAYGAGLFVAVGQGGAIYTGNYTGIGGVNWTPQISNVSSNLNAILWTGSTFVAVGDAGTVVYSTDGATWTPTSTGYPANLHGIATNGSILIAVGDSGTILTTGSLLTTPWAVAASNTTQTLLNIALLSGHLVVSGANGTLLVSTDAVNWPQAALLSPLPAGVALHGAAYGANAPVPNVVVVGDQGTVLTSTDFVNFTKEAPTGAGNLLAVWYGSRYMTVGSGGTIFHSDDGGIWTPPTTVTPGPITQNLNGVVFGNGLYTAVGDAGADAYSSN